MKWVEQEAAIWDLEVGRDTMTVTWTRGQVVEMERRMMCSTF